MSGNREALTAVDTAWLHMERPTNPMCITGLLFFDEPVELDAVKKLIEERLITHERFRERVIEPRLGVGPPHWEPEPGFDLDWHVRREVLREPKDEAALKALISDVMSTALPLDRSPWRFHLVEAPEGGGSVLIGRFHHCMGDGSALIHLLLSLTDEVPPEEGEKQQDHPHHGPIDGLVHAAGALLHEGLETLLHPTHALELVKAGISAAAALGKLVLMEPDEPTLFRGEIGTIKRAAWSVPVALSTIKQIGRAMEATVNDVLIAAMTGALRRYLVERGAAPPRGSMRAVVPVDLRPRGEVPSLGNHFGLVFLDLPIEFADAAQRVRELKRRMDKIKHSPEAYIGLGILGAMGAAIPMVEDKVIDAFSRRATAVMTNVPGPRQLIHLAGKTVRSVMFWVPQSGDLGLGVSILSYAGEVRLGVAADALRVPDPQRVVDAFVVEIAELAAHYVPHG